MKQPQVKDEFLRKRAERQRKIRKRRLIISFFVMIIMLLCVGVVLSLTVFFPIENIKISGSEVYEAAQIQKVCSVEKGDNLFTVSGKEIENRLKKELPFIESIKLERKLPSTLQIKVTDAEKYAYYLQNDKYYLVSESGWVMEESGEPQDNLFVISGAAADCSVGEKIMFADENGLELVTTISNVSEKAGVTINSIDISDTVAISLKAEGRFIVNLGTANNLEEKILHLGAMISKIDSEKTGEINLSIWTENNTKATFKETRVE